MKKTLTRLRYAMRIPRTWRYLVTFQADGRTAATIVELGWKIRHGDDLAWIQSELLDSPIFGVKRLITGYRLMAVVPFRRAVLTEQKYVRFA